MRTRGTGPDVQQEPGFLDVYLERIGVADDDVRRAEPGRGLLERVVAHHLAAVPFENLDIHQGRVVTVDRESVADQILRRRRGGICYEVNGILAQALEALGFDVALIGAAVYSPTGDLGRPLGHMAVLVSTAGDQWLADVGFGGSSIVTPIPTAQRNAAIDVATSTGRYRTEPAPRPIGDFAEMAHWHSTNPDARFTRSIVCSITIGRCRSTLSRSPSESFTLTETDIDSGAKARFTVPDSEVLELFRSRFGITLADVPVPADFG